MLKQVQHDVTTKKQTWHMKGRSHTIPVFQTTNIYKPPPTVILNSFQDLWAENNKKNSRWDAETSSAWQQNEKWNVASDRDDISMSECEQHV